MDGITRPIHSECDICPCKSEDGLRCASWDEPINCRIAARDDAGRRRVLEKSRRRAGRPLPAPREPDLVIERGRPASSPPGPGFRRKLSDSDYEMLKVISRCPHSEPCNCTRRKCGLGKGTGGKVSVFDCLACVGTDARVAWELARIEPAVARSTKERKAKKRAIDARPS